MEEKKQREIIIIDGIAPEAVAMIQAKYSRSPRSAKIHLEEVAKVGPEKFMASYYVGYGHKSIGDCGTTTICSENVSMLVAKAIQDWPLYSGQEASTRYLDMANQPVIDPLGTKESKEIQDEWMKFYRHVLDALVPSLKARFPLKEGEKETIYEKAIKARAFDIARGFLPAGATTYVAWHTNLRQAYDHMKEMRQHPLEEVRGVANEILSGLKAKYPSSFGYPEYPAEDEYIEKTMAQFAYFDDATIKDFSYEVRLDLEGLKKHQKILAERPPKTELHQRLREYGNIIFSFPLDFGSYRDLQRHRSAVQEMPLLSTSHGFYPWYLEQLTPELKKEALELLALQEKRIAKLKTSKEIKQYYVAMGYTVTVKITCPLPSAVYIAELRSGDAVHPTLRREAQRMGDAIKECVPNIAMHHDTSPGIWNIKRGLHDIVKK